MAATDDVQAWVSQLTALTSQKGNTAGDAAKENGDASLSKKPPQGLNRKRPGTGRKLPSIPTDRSPVSSEHSSYIGDQDLSIGDDIPSTRASDFTATGKNNSSSNGKKPGRISSQRTISNGHKEDGTSIASPHSSVRSRGSMDTELLLQDTEKVMAAMEARVAYKSSRDKRSSYSVDSDTDVSSTVALVNGDEDYVKPTVYKSPREAMAKRQTKDVASKPKTTASTPPASASKKPVVKSYSQKGASKSKTASSPCSTPSGSAATPKKSVVSDVFSRRDSIDNDSIMSDVSSDLGDGNLSRSSSKGKGNITMTKPNRAFELRRARADSLDEPTTPRSAKSRGSTKSVASSSSARSSSVHSSSRNRSLVDTGRSEASLGADIVKKSQNNAAQDRARRSSGAGVSRVDSGKQSQKLQRASSITLSQGALSSSSQGKRESTPKSHLRSTPTGKGSLAITGISSSISNRSQSQPGSRSNSPKAAERMAWKRRKEYDPRKAVADAKAKAKDGSGVTMRPKPSASSNIKRRMIRSASFTNSKGVGLGMHDSVSGSQDFSDRRGQYDQEDFRRAFLPFQNSLRTDRSTHSADEDDSLVSAASAQDRARSMASLTITPEPKSAFTPPLLQAKSVSPGDSPSPQALLLRRKTSNISEGDSGQPKAPPAPQANGDAADSGLSSVESPPQTSYDSLIVTSIYQLTLKLKTSTDKTLSRLRDENRVSHTPSPIDDFLSDSGKSEITAWKSANQELAFILKNLRKLERHVQMMNTVLFPEDEMNSDVSSGLPSGGQGKQKYFQEIERIRSELAGFHPIDHPRPEEHEVASPEMDELMNLKQF